jgi:hypothetical protein
MHLIVKTFFYLLLLLLAPAVSFAQNAPDTATAKTPVRKTEKLFPFIIDDGDPEYDLSVNLADQGVNGKFTPLFKKNNVPYTSDALEEVVIQLLEKADPMLAQNITYLTDEKILYINTGNKLYQQAVLNILRPVMYDNQKFDDFLKNMDRTNIE